MCPDLPYRPMSGNKKTQVSQSLGDPLLTDALCERRYVNMCGNAIFSETVCVHDFFMTWPAQQLQRGELFKEHRRSIHIRVVLV